MDLQFIVTKQFKSFGQQEENSTSYRTGNEVTAAWKISGCGSLQGLKLHILF